jgi:hypothetical protein
MIRVFRDRTGKYPVPSYTEAACDRCGLICPTSHVPGTTLAAADEAEAAAKRVGWVERSVRRKERAVWTVELLCPGCLVGLGNGGCA